MAIERDERGMHYAMYRRLSAILFPIMTLAFIGTAVWGYQENQEKNAILIKAENQYQRAFHDLSYHVEQLNTELGKTIAVNSDSTDYYRRGLANVWRITSEAQNEINQLPLTLLPFNQTEEFLSNISSFSYRTAIRDLQKNPMSDGERQTLMTLYERSKEISKELQDVQGKVLVNNLRWMDVEAALATQDKQQDNTIVDGFKTVDKKVSEYEEVDWGPSMASTFQKHSMTALAGNDVTADEAKHKAADFLGISDLSGLKVVENGNGTEFSSFSVTGKAPGTQHDVQMDLSKKGGHILYFLTSRDVAEKVIDVPGVRDAAADFLDTHGYKDMVPVSYDEYENVASITHVRKAANVLIYPEKLTVKVALDDAEILGLQATDYVYEHKERQIPAPALNEEQARKELNPGFKMESQTLAWVKNDMDQEILCYEFTGRINGGGYKVYINAENGNEEKIEPYHTEDSAD